MSTLNVLRLLLGLSASNLHKKQSVDRVVTLVAWLVLVLEANCIKQPER